MHDYFVSNELQHRRGMFETFYGICLHCNVSFTDGGQWRFALERRGPKEMAGQLLLFVHSMGRAAPFVKDPVQTMDVEEGWTEKVFLVPACKEVSACKVLWVHDNNVIGKISLPIAKIETEEERKIREQKYAKEEEKKGEETIQTKE